MLVNKRTIGTVAPMCGLPAVLTPFAVSLARMVQHTYECVLGPDERIELLPSQHSFHDVARNQLARDFAGDFLLFLDTDHQFGPDLLARLLKVLVDTQADVVTGLYLHRGAPYEPTLWKFIGPDMKAVKFSQWPPGEIPPQSEILEVDCAGGGCLLVRRHVFDRIRAELGEEPFSRYEMERQAGVVGEDFAFFRRVKALGMQVVCPLYIECNHLVIRPLEFAKDFDITAVSAEPN